MSNIVGPIDGYQFNTAHAKCKHCGATGFHTKNIDYIGARTIFDFAGGCQWMKDRCQPCNCGPGLVIDQEAHQHIAHCTECQEYGY